MYSCDGPLKLMYGEMPWLIAVASVNGLNDEPACRPDCVARLNFIVRPPGMYVCIALTAPVRGSIATSAAAGTVFSRRMLLIALSAEYCMRGSIVVRTLRPPASTFRAPNFATSWSVAQPKKFGWRCSAKSEPSFRPSGCATDSEYYVGQ